MSQISLTAPMRSNLLSLQNIARQQDIVQNRLATGLKVSSAIDNPSAYYTAASLSNRAADLTALLDAMSQGVQTIKTASEAIDSAASFLEQAKATANQALENASGLPENSNRIDYTSLTKLDKSWYEAQVGANGAVVETEDELKAALAAGKETIVVYGKINITSTVNLQKNQKLVGTEYFADKNINANYRENVDEYSSQLIFNNANKASAVFVNEDNVVVSDLKIVLNNDVSTNQGALAVLGAKDVSLHNLDLTHHAQSSQSCGIVILNSASTTISGNIKILSSNQTYQDIAIYNFGSDVFIDNAQIDIQAKENAILTGSQGFTHIMNNSTLNLDASCAFYSNIGTAGGNTLLIDSGSVINARAALLFYNESSSAANAYTGNNDNYIQLAAGVTVNWTNKTTGNNLLLQTMEEYRLSNTTKYSLLTGENLLQDFAWESLDIPEEDETVEKYKSQYLTILEQYNMLITDSSYKGINLLQGQKLQINFNEDRSSKVAVKGVKADSESLGLTTKEWESKEDIEKSISELESAISSLRSFASAFGNYYSIVTTRQDFTENLINVLEEGADKLTLADMNEESANMLALQTSQQLAINSLSLASQASQSVLKLF